MRLLIIEDELDLLNALSKGLKKSGYLVDAASDGVEGLALAQISSYDLIILDLNLPGLDGLEILSAIRSKDFETRVLILSARTEISQRILGLDSGANDYLAKPFDFGELSARVRSLLRRSFRQENSMISFHGFCYDTIKRTLSASNGKTVNLSPKEISILEYLLLHRDTPVSMEQLVEHVWEGDESLFSNACKVHISTLRKKLSAYCGYDIIRWMRSSGYMIEEESK